MSYKILLCIGFSMLIAGCQSVSTAVPPLADPGGDITLIFNRENSVLTSIWRARVFIGDTDVCAIPIGDSCQVNISAGSYVLKVFPFGYSTLGTFTHRYEFKSGKTYRFVISPNDPALIINFIGPGSIIYTEANRTSSEDTDNGDLTMKLVDEY